MLAPLENEFMVRAIAEIALIGAAGAAIGCWVVLYRLSYAAESLAHATLPGIVLAALAGVPLLLGGAPAILLAALAIGLVSRAPGVDREVGVGVVVTTMFGLGALLALSPATPPGLQELLFGDILGVGDADLLAAACLAACAALALALLHGRLLATGFDRTAAGRVGASPAVAEAALVILLALAIVVAVQALGNLLVVAVFVGPAAAAAQLTERAGAMIAAAVAIAVGSGIAGLYASYYLGTAGGASIALAIVLAYVLALVSAAAMRRATIG